MTKEMIADKWKPIVNALSKVNYDLAMLCENTDQFCKLNDLDFTSSLARSMSVLVRLSEADIQIVSAPTVLIDANGTIVEDGGTAINIPNVKEEIFEIKPGAKVYYYHSVACEACDTFSHRMRIV